MSYGTRLKKLRLAAGKTVEQAAKSEGVSPRLWAYWEADQKLPPKERDALTRERLLERWEGMAASSSNGADQTRAANKD